MRMARRSNEPISIAFLDVITCGFGAIILLLMIAKFGDPPEPEPTDDPRIAQISGLQRSLFELQSRENLLANDLGGKRQQLQTWDAEASRLQQTLSAAPNCTPLPARNVMAQRLRVSRHWVGRGWITSRTGP